METKNKAEVVRKKPLWGNFVDMFFVNHIGTAGGLCLTWKADCILSIFKAAPFFIHLLVRLFTI